MTLLQPLNFLFFISLTDSFPTDDPFALARRNLGSLIVPCRCFPIGAFIPVPSCNFEPSFLANVSDHDLARFRAILQNRSLTKGELENRLDEWAQGQEESVLESYLEDKANRAELKKRMKAIIKKTMASVSDDAKSVISRIEAIRENSSLTIGGEMLEVFTVMQEATVPVRTEIWALQNKLRHFNEFAWSYLGYTNGCRCHCREKTATKKPSTKAEVPNGQKRHLRGKLLNGQGGQHVGSVRLQQTGRYSLWTEVTNPITTMPWRIPIMNQRYPIQNKIRNVKGPPTVSSGDFGEILLKPQ